MVEGMGLFPYTFPNSNSWWEAIAASVVIRMKENLKLAINCDIL